MKLPYRLFLYAGLGVLVSLPVAVMAQGDSRAEVLQRARSGKPAEALAAADRLLAAKPDDAQLRFLRGIVLADMGRTAEAITTFQQLTREFPSMPEPYNNLAVAYAAQGQYEKAREALEGAIVADASYTTAYENLGDVYAHLARQAYTQALRQGSSDPAIEPKLGLIRSVIEPRGTRPASGSTAQKPSTPTRKEAAALAAARPAATAPAPSSTAAPSAMASADSVPAQTDPAVVAARSEVEAAVRRWAAAWAGRDVTGYLAAYGADFATPSGMTRQRWEDTRRQRISEKSSIRLEVEQLAVSVTGDQATARFMQSYSADRVQEKGRKTLSLRLVQGHWLIVREASGG